MAQYDFNLRDYWRILRKRKVVVIVTTILMGTLTFLFAKFQKIEPIYTAVASVKIDWNRPVLGGERPAAFEIADYVETQSELISSFPVMVLAAKQLGLLDPKLTEDEIRNDPELLQVALNLKEQIETEKETVTNIVNITATAADPVFAEQIANTTAQLFRQWDFGQKHAQVNDTRIFIEKQRQKVKADLESGEDALKLLKEETGSVSVDTQATEDFHALTKAESDLAETERKLKEVNIILTHLREEKQLPTRNAAGRPGASPSIVVQKMKDRLQKHLIERDTLLLEFTDNHPDIKTLNIKIEETIQDILEQLEAEQSTLLRKKQLLWTKLADLQERIASYPEVSLALARLERDINVNASTLAQLEESYQDILIRSAQRVFDVTIIRPALSPPIPINQPAVIAISLAGTLLGLLLGCILAFIFEALDTSIGAIEDVETFLEVPVLGIIPQMDTDDVMKKLRGKKKGPGDEDLRSHAMLIIHFDPRSSYSESFRALRTNIQYLHIEYGYKTFIVTSTNPLEGKSSTVSNLAITFAQMGKRTLLVDGDLRKPELHRSFGLDRRGGLTDIILGDQPWQDTVKSITDLIMGTFDLDDILQSPGMDNLDIITCGDIPPNPSEIHFSENMNAFLEEVREAYDYVIIDTPPVVPVSDAAILGSKCDGVILVYEVGRVARSALKRAKFLIENVKGKVVGVVLNKLKAEASPDFYELEYYRYHGKKYAYGYGVEEEEQARRGFFRHLLRRK